MKTGKPFCDNLNVTKATTFLFVNQHLRKCFSRAVEQKLNVVYYINFS